MTGLGVGAGLSGCLDVGGALKRQGQGQAQPNMRATSWSESHALYSTSGILRTMLCPPGQLLFSGHGFKGATAASPLTNHVFGLLGFVYGPCHVSILRGCFYAFCCFSAGAASSSQTLVVDGAPEVVVFG